MSHLEPSAPEDGRTRARPTVTWRAVARVGVAVVMTLLGLLWVLQGADIVRIEPIGCVVECQPITGGSAKWLAIGALTMLGGLVLLGGPRVLGVLRRRR